MLTKGLPLARAQPGGGHRGLSLAASKFQETARILCAMPWLRCLMVMTALSLMLAACDGPSYLNVDNQSQSTYIGSTGDGHHVVIPPKRKVNVAKFPFEGVPVTPTSPVQLFDSQCKLLGTYDQPGTIVITDGGSASYRSESPGQGDVGEDSSFCSQPAASPTR